jgi:hypothetical protein
MEDIMKSERTARNVAIAETIVRKMIAPHFASRLL